MQKRTLPPVTVDNEQLWIEIRYLRMLLRLVLSGIDAGDFSLDAKEARERTDAIRQQF